MRRVLAPLDPALGFSHRDDSGGLDGFLEQTLGWAPSRVRWTSRAFLFLTLAVALVPSGAGFIGQRNVAFGRPVTASSARFGYPGALTNGAVEWGTFGLHTNGGDAWATIDLGAPYVLSRAKVYGRGDGHFDSGLPLRIEVSDDGVSFRAGSSCDTRFLQAVPCEAPLHETRARYVRVHSNSIVLSEVEIYGSP